MATGPHLTLPSPLRGEGGVSPAAGRALADLIVDGKSDPDLTPISVERFADGYRDPAALEAACVAQYARRYTH